MKQPLTFCITLKDHEYSMSMLTECLNTAKKYDWVIEPFWATNGSILTEQHWKDIGVVPRTEKKGFFKPGAHGCFFSHWNLWNKCVELNEPIVILEQDAVINGPWDTNLNLEQGLIKLHPIYSSKKPMIDEELGIWSRSSHAYFLGPTQAQQLINWSKNVGAFATDMIIGTKVLQYKQLEYELVGRNDSRQSTTTHIDLK